MPRFGLRELRFSQSQRRVPNLTIPVVDITIFPTITRSIPVGGYINFVNFAGTARVGSLNGFSSMLDLRNTEYLMNFSKIPILVKIFVQSQEAVTLLSPNEVIYLGGAFAEYDRQYASPVGRERVPPEKRVD